MKWEWQMWQVEMKSSFEKKKKEKKMCKLTLLGRCKSEKVSFTITKKHNYWQTLVYSMRRENIATIIKMGFLNQSSLL